MGDSKKCKIPAGKGFETKTMLCQKNAGHYGKHQVVLQCGKSDRITITWPIAIEKPND